MIDPAPAERSASSARAGFVAIVGLPNVGKSTLLNRLVGEKLAIVTPKAQTTRQRLLGIRSESGCQAVFVDTPGLLEPRYALHESMRGEAEEALVDADVVVYVADAGFPEGLEHARAWAPPPDVPAILCLNKVDRLDPDAAASRLAELAARPQWEAAVATVASEGKRIDELWRTIAERLPPGPPFYPPDDLAVAPLRFFAAELVRETCFEELAQEVPYGTAVAVEEFKEDREPVYISARIYVERESQKGIVVGKGGRTIRKIGIRSREKIERLVDRRVYLDLRVKVLANWRKRPDKLKLLGYPLHGPGRGR